MSPGIVRGRRPQGWGARCGCWDGSPLAAGGCTGSPGTQQRARRVLNPQG